VDVGFDRTLGEGLDRFFSQLVSWTFPGEETGGIEATFETTGGKTALNVQSVESDGSPRDFYATSAVIVGPDLEPRTVGLVQVAPGVYETPLGEIDPGAYAVRITQTRPGSSPLGRTVGLVAQTAAEYRQLGPNEPFLASLRTATGGSVVATAADPWAHDLTATDRFTELRPLLLVLALLLWPLDIALRRMSVGRREFAAAGAWVRGIGRRRRTAGPRTATAEGMLAASERVRSNESRVALRAAAAESGVMAPAPGPAELTPASVAAATPPTADAAGPTPAIETETADTLARLRDAKRRARDR
jgi:hypothetical protein